MQNNSMFRGYSGACMGLGLFANKWEKDYSCSWHIDNYSARCETQHNFRSPAFTADGDDFMWYLELQVSRTQDREYADLTLFPAYDADFEMYRPVSGFLKVHAYSEPKSFDASDKSGSFKLTDNERTGIKLSLFNHSSTNRPIKLSIRSELLYNKTNNIDTAECSLSRDLERIRIDENYNDMTISVKGKTYPIHRVILAARSSVFDAMFKSKMQESQKNHITITDINQDVFEEMLHYIYTGSTTKLEELAYELFPAADKYDLQGLKSTCAQVLSYKLSLDNAVDILMLADKHNAEFLKSNTINYIKRNKTSNPDFKNTELWKILSSSRPELMKDVLAAFFE